MKYPGAHWSHRYPWNPLRQKHWPVSALQPPSNTPGPEHWQAVETQDTSERDDSDIYGGEKISSVKIQPELTLTVQSEMPRDALIAVNSLEVGFADAYPVPGVWPAQVPLCTSSVTLTVYTEE